MIILIHGDDITASREYYLSERIKIAEKKIVDGTTLTSTDILQLLSGNGLFGTQETIFIEELVSKRKSPKDIEDFGSILSASEDIAVFLWESKMLTAKQISFFKNAHVFPFKIPTVIFAFLDSLRPTNTKQMLKLYHEVLTHNDASYVLFMLQRHMRILLTLKDNSPIESQTISEVSRMAPWQASKFRKQASLFTLNQLLHLHQQLYQLDYDQKTGNLSLVLPDAIDFFLASI